MNRPSTSTIDYIEIDTPGEPVNRVKDYMLASGWYVVKYQGAKSGNSYESIEDGRSLARWYRLQETRAQ